MAFLLYESSDGVSNLIFNWKPFGILVAHIGKASTYHGREHVSVKTRIAWKFGHTTDIWKVYYCYESVHAPLEPFCNWIAYHKIPDYT